MCHLTTCPRNRARFTLSAVSEANVVEGPTAFPQTQRTGGASTSLATRASLSVTSALGKLRVTSALRQAQSDKQRNDSLTQHRGDRGVDVAGDDHAVVACVARSRRGGDRAKP